MSGFSRVLGSRSRKRFMLFISFIILLPLHGILQALLAYEYLYFIYLGLYLEIRVYFSLLFVAYVQAFVLWLKVDINIIIFYQSHIYNSGLVVCISNNIWHKDFCEIF